MVMAKDACEARGASAIHRGRVMEGRRGRRKRCRSRQGLQENCRAAA